MRAAAERLAVVRDEPREEQSRDDVLARLRQRVERMQGRRLSGRTLPAPEALAGLFSGGGLRAGGAYTLDATRGCASLLLALLAPPTREGVWCAAVGMPELGIEAAEQFGVDLSRLVLVPDPGTRWLAVVATLAEVFGVVAVRPPARTREAEAARLAARLRDREAVLLVQGDWPQAEATIGVGEPQWSGLGEGHGRLASRSVVVDVRARRIAGSRRARVLLPDPGGALVREGCRVAPVESVAPVRAPVALADLRETG